MKIGRVGGSYFLGILALVTFVFFAMLKPFLIAILLAALLAGLFNPLYHLIRRKIWDKPAFASIVCVILVLLLIVLPMIFILGLITVQAVQFANSVDVKITLLREKAPDLLAWVEAQPWLAKIDLGAIEWQSKVAEGAKVVSTFLLKTIGKTSQSALQTVAMSFIMLYTMFFFLIDGPALLNRIKYLSPIKDEYEDQIIARFTSIARATMKGTVVIGLVQGVLGGATFAIFGVASPVFWGTMMVILSVLPGIGATLIWAPAAIIAFITGHTGSGIGILVGGLIIGATDNLLRPILVGRDTKMHELMILFSTLGGIALFGIVGFILGPILAAVFITVTEIYALEYQDELDGLTAKEKEAEEAPEYEPPDGRPLPADDEATTTDAGRIDEPETASGPKPKE